MLARFEDLTGYSGGFRLNMNDLPATLGRAEDATVKVRNLLVSRYHCEIFVERGQLNVRDLNSMNGTLLNGQSVTKAVICPGDTLQIGLQQFFIHEIDSSLLESSLRESADGSMATAAV